MTSDLTAPVSGAHTTNGTPHGYSSLTPFIVVDDPSGALTFYRGVFGARVVNSTTFADTIVHAELAFPNGRLQLGAAQPDYHLVAPGPACEDVSYSFGLYCPNVDELLARAVAAGATLREPAMTFVSGDRFASIRDPFGVRWSLMTRVEDLSDEESDARVKEWAAEQN